MPVPTVRPRPSKGILLLLCLLLMLGFCFQGTRALWSTDEGRYTANALQMIDSGNYLIPAYSSERFNFSKPPMTYWVIASAVRVLGRSTWAVRTPYALAFVLTALLLCAMGRWILPDKPWLPGLVYGCALGPFVASNVVSTDVVLTLCEAIAMYGFVTAEFAPGRRNRRVDLWLMWLGFGLAFLTKGPPGLIPLLAILPSMVIRGGWRGLRRLFPPIGVGLFLLVGFGWYAAVVLRHHELLHYFLHYEIYDRIFTATQHRHPQWYGWIEAYAPVFVFGTLPWWPALGRGLRDAGSITRWRQWRHHFPSRLFLLLWLLIPLAVFCFAQSRLPLYVLPLFLPLSLLLALKLRHRIDLTGRRQQVLLLVWVAVLIGIKAGFGFFAHPDNDNRLRAQALAKATGEADYASLTFVQHTDSRVAIQEHTPWGMRLYTGKPVYGVAWLAPDRVRKVCRLLRTGMPVLYLVADDIKPASFSAALTRCHAQAVHLGNWRQRRLMLVREQDTG